MNIQAAPSPRLYTRPPLGIVRVIEYAQAGAVFVGGRCWECPSFADSARSSVAFVRGRLKQTYWPPVPVDGEPHSDSAHSSAAFIGGRLKQTYWPPVTVDGEPHSDSARSSAAFVGGRLKQTYWPPVPIDRAFSHSTHAAAVFVRGKCQLPKS